MIKPPRKRGANPLRGFRRAVTGLLLWGVLPTALPAAEVRLLDLRAAQVRETVQAQAAPGGESRPLRLTISAGVVQQDLVLAPNLSLGLGARSLGAQATAYEGELPNLPGSWARLTRTPGGWIGVWFDGARHFGLDLAGNLVGTHPLAGQSPPGTPLLFSLADARLVDGDFDGDVVVAAPSGEDLLDGVAEPSGAPALGAATLPLRRLSVALVADAELVELDGSSTGANLLARLNIIDGIFASQVGVRIAAGSSTLLSAATQPFNSTDPATLLQQLRQYRSNSGTQQAAGLSHLMTGRNLNDRTVGIAYIEGLCSSRYGASLSEARSGVSFDALIAAHEIGHVFGSPHDGEDACAATPSDRLMARELNGSSIFSACSLEQMAPVVASASCLAPIDAADVSLGAPLSAQIAAGQATALALTVRSEGSVATQDVELQVELERNAGISATGTVEGGSACQAGAALLRCALGTLAPGTVRTVQLQMLAAQTGSQRATLRLAAANDALPGNNSGNIDLQVVEGADLSVSMSAEPARLATGGTATATVQLRNLGLSAALRSALVVDVPAGFVATAASPSGLSCAIVAAGVNCEPVDLAAGMSASVVLTLRADSAGDRTLVASASSARFDPQPSNNEVRVELSVSTPPAGAAGANSGGGGGGGGAAMLLLLGVLAYARRPSIARSHRGWPEK